MASRPLNPLDASWLMVESRDTPMHVGGLLVFELPERAAPDYLQRMMADFRASTRFAPPWNYRLRKPGGDTGKRRIQFRRQQLEVQ